jgi:protein involved in polysaccharide export with SLBB domain
MGFENCEVGQSGRTVAGGSEMRERVTRVLILLDIVFLLCSSLPAAAQQEPPVDPEKPVSKPDASSKSEVQHPTPAERNPRYRICRDDVLLLSFPLSPELNQKVVVEPDGFISLQSAGEVRVEGLTVPGVVEAVKKAYASTLHDPIVNVDLADFQKPFFTVLGQVGKPGQYDLRYDITVTQAIAVAGGFAATGKTQVFLYRSVSSNWAEVRELKIKDILNGKNISEDVHLRPGDMIFVPEKAITKFQRYVPYNVGISPYSPPLH